mgnify:CR=1 FL=1
MLMLEDPELRVAGHLFQEYGKARGALARSELAPALVDELVRVAPHPVPLEFRDREGVDANFGVSFLRQILYRRRLGASTLPNPLDTSAPNAPLTYATVRGDPAIVNALLRAGANPNYADPESGWTALMAACNGTKGSVSCAIALIKAGANLEAFSNPSQRTPLVFAVYSNRRVIPILLRAGARIDRCMNRIGNLSQSPYMPRTASRAIFVGKVHAAGGWKKYEQAHRKRLTTTFAKAFPRLPVDAISHVVDFAFHVGFY